MNRATATALLAIAVLAATASAADALTWSATKELPGRYSDVDVTGPPLAAINRRGDVIVSWIGEQGATEVALRGHGGALSKPLRTSGTFGGTPTLAIAAGGRATIGWSDATTDAAAANYATVSASGRVGPAHRIEAGSFTPPSLAAQPDGSTLALYVAPDARKRGRVLVRTMRISPKGAPGRLRRTLGTPTDDVTVEVASAAGGQIVACCHKAAGGKAEVWLYSPSKGWSTVRIPLAARERISSLSIAGGAAVLQSGKRVVLVRGGKATLLAAVPRAKLLSAVAPDATGRVLGTYDGAASVLQGVVFGPAGIAGAAVALGTHREARFFDGVPVIGAWAGGAVLAWPDKRRWRVATEAAGMFAPAPAPTGVVGYPGLATAGEAAVLSWYDNNHHAYISVGRR